MNDRSHVRWLHFWPMFLSRYANTCKRHCVKLCVMRYKQGDHADSEKHMGAQCPTYPGDVRDTPGFVTA